MTTLVKGGHISVKQHYKYFALYCYSAGVHKDWLKITETSLTHEVTENVVPFKKKIFKKTET